MGPDVSSWHNLQSRGQLGVRLNATYGNMRALCWLSCQLPVAQQTVLHIPAVYAKVTQGSSKSAKYRAYRGTYVRRSQSREHVVVSQRYGWAEHCLWPSATATAWSAPMPPYFLVLEKVTASWSKQIELSMRAFPSS